MIRRRRDALRDGALALVLWPLWLVTAGPGLAASLALDRLLVQHRQKRPTR